MPITPAQIRNRELPKSFRGFEESATTELLSEAARALEQALADLHAAEQKLKQPRPEVAAAPTPEPVSEAETLGAALLNAQRLGERLVNEARDEAARITAQAEAKAGELLAQADAEVRSKVGELAGHVEALRRSERELAATLDGRRQLIVRYVHQVGEQLSELARIAGSPGTDNRPAELDRTLQTRVESVTPPPDAA